MDAQVPIAGLNTAVVCIDEAGAVRARGSVTRSGAIPTSRSLENRKLLTDWTEMLLKDRAPLLGRGELST